MTEPVKDKGITTQSIGGQSSPIIIKKERFNIDLDLEDLPRSVPSPQQYQKLLINDWPPKDLIDSSFLCIFCRLQSSPRSTTPIIAKSYFINQEENLTPRRAKKYVEYCCHDCINGLRSTTSSPRIELEFAPSSPSFSPRDSTERKVEVIRRRRSITDKRMGDSSPSQSRSPVLIRTKSSNHDNASPNFRSSPARNSSLRRSKTMDQSQINKNLEKTKEKQTIVNNLSH